MIQHPLKAENIGKVKNSNLAQMIKIDYVYLQNNMTA
jgi:hypothetical protein